MNEVKQRKLNIACGSNWKLYPDFDGLDIIDFGQKYKIDVFRFFENKQVDDYYDVVMANHFIEHLNNSRVEYLLKLIHKSLKKDGIFKIVTPHKNRDEAYYLVHRSYYTEATFKVFDNKEFRRVYNLPDFKVKSIVTNHKGDIHCELQKI